MKYYTYYKINAVTWNFSNNSGNRYVKLLFFDVPESTADSKLVFKLTVIDEKGDAGEDEVTVDVAQIPQDESDSEDESN